MTTTYDIREPVYAASAAVNFGLPNVANLKVIDTRILEDGGRETLYQEASGSADLPFTLRVGYYPPKNGNGNYSISIKASTFCTRLDDVTIINKPFTMTLATTSPFLAVPDPAAFKALVQFIVGILASDISTNEFTWAGVDALAYGITDIAAL